MDSEPWIFINVKDLVKILFCNSNTSKSSDCTILKKHSKFLKAIRCEIWFKLAAFTLLIRMLKHFYWSSDPTWLYLQGYGLQNSDGYTVLTGIAYQIVERIYRYHLCRSASVERLESKKLTQMKFWSTNLVPVLLHCSPRSPIMKTCSKLRTRPTDSVSLDTGSSVDEGYPWKASTT